MKRMSQTLAACRRAKRRGAAAVEFALVAPLFFMLVMGMVEYGRMIMVQQVITNASREGARRAVLDNATTADVQSLVQDYLENGAVEGATVTVSPSPPSSAAAGDAVTVSVSIPFEDVSWLPGAFYLNETTLNADTVMCRENPQ